MTQTITAYFDSPAEARSAADQLASFGVDRKDVNVVNGDAESGAIPSHRAEPKGFFESISDFFIPDEDRSTYEEGIRRGGAVVTVRAGEDQFDGVCDVLERAGAVDLDTRESEWRSEGWTGHQPAGMAEAPAGYQTDETLSRETAAGDGDYIPVAEEQLRFGKRDVNHGRVRVRSYVVETPVEESVSLRDETVQVDRSRVDRAATPADQLFRDQTIEVEEHDEEAVVSKETRVTEEVRLHKDAEVREEVVRDSVRHTEVEVDDERTGAGREDRAGTRPVR